MKKILIFCVTVIFCSSMFGIINNGCLQEILDWKRIEIDWNNYIENPTEINTSILIEAFPKNIIISADEINTHRSIVDNIYDDLDVLERRILSGSRASVEIAFRLYAITDGAFAEELTIILGFYLNKNIEHFLETISNYPRLIEPLLESVLVSVKPELLDDVVAVIKELEYRRKILKNVQKPSLQKLKSKCLHLIDKNLKELKELSK